MDEERLICRVAELEGLLEIQRRRNEILRDYVVLVGAAVVDLSGVLQNALEQIGEGENP